VKLFPATPEKHIAWAPLRTTICLSRRRYSDDKIIISYKIAAAAAAADYIGDTNNDINFIYYNIYLRLYNYVQDDGGLVKVR